MILKEDNIKEYCGVFGISCNDFSYSVSSLIYPGLMAIQHRGHLFSGLSVTNCDGKIVSYSNRGLVSKVLNPIKLKSFAGNVGIGHVNYGSHSYIGPEDTQPYHFKSGNSEFSIALNGAITNYIEIHNILSNMGRIITGKSHVELIATLLDTFLRFNNNKMLKALSKIMEILKGAYSFVVLKSDGNLYAVRDPIGYKPLCYGKIEINNKLFYAISSESCSIDVIGGELIGDVKPGEVININPIEGLKKHQILTKNKTGICQFEYIYFARPDSIIEGISVGEVRYKLGKILAHNDNINSDNAIVVPVPDSGRSAAMGYACGSGIVYQEGFMKNRYMWQLKNSISDKLNPIKAIVKDRDIILIDDSILSGNTMKKIVSMLRSAGALQVHVRISSPPIINDCQKSSSISKKDLLIAFQKKVKSYNNFNEAMRKYIGSDSLKYQTIEGLVEAIGLKRNQICLDCLTEYCQVNEEKENHEIKLMIY